MAKQYAYAPPVRTDKAAVQLTRDYETNARNVARCQGCTGCRAPRQFAEYGPQIGDCTMPAAACQTPRELSSLGRSLPHFAQALTGQDEVIVVAIGSSSTEGDGASGPAASYPSRLGVALTARNPTRAIKILNLGLGGQEAPDEAARFKKDVVANKPALVIWQVGTNAAWKDYYLDDVRAGILRGLDHLSGIGADVGLMNLQFAPALLDQKEHPTPATQQMLDIISGIAAEARIPVFRRFEIMRYWRQELGVPFDQMISNFDGNWLHQNDWSYK